MEFFIIRVNPSSFFLHSSLGQFSQSFADFGSRPLGMFGVVVVGSQLPPKTEMAVRTVDFPSNQWAHSTHAGVNIRSAHIVE
jgi:hypothetical protein